MNKEIQEVQLEYTLMLLNKLIEEQQPFRLVIHQNDDWNHPLPDEVMERFPDHLTLDILPEVFEHINYNDEEPTIPELMMMFILNGQDGEYFKSMYPEDIVAIVNITDNQPMLINNFNLSKRLSKEEQKVLDEATNDTYYKPTTKDEWIQNTVEDGITDEGAQQSVEAFMKNNPDILIRR